MDVIWDYRGQLFDGLIVTVELALGSLVLAVALGLAGAGAKLSASGLARGLAGAYTTLVRGVPDLVLILLVFFGGQQLLNQFGEATGWWDYVDFDQLIAGIVTVGLIFGAYMTETFRGAFLAVPRGQIEAARAIGMPGRLRFARILWPQMIRFALPGFTNTWLVQIKATALVSVIGLQDLLYNAYVAGRSTRQPFTFIFAVFVIYLLLTALSDAGLRWVDRRYSHGMARPEL